MAKSSSKKDTLPLQALRLLVPPVRLVCAAMWKVMKERDVMQYGTLEEFVTSSCETAPGLLTHRHQAKLGLGLRARLILELCRGQDSPDPNTILPHLERIRVPVTLSSDLKTKRDIKIEAAVSNFHDFVSTILRDPTEREQFYKEEFLTEYGPQFDLQLEKLLWEFLVRLDQLLPVPNFVQTVSSWLNVAPSVMEECVLVASQPQHMKALLQHQSCLGHIEPAASLPPCLGDTILSSLSLPPSRKVRESSPSVMQTGPLATNHRQPRDSLPFIDPVIGRMSTKDLPIMLAARRRAGSDPVGLRDSLEQSDSTGSSKCTALKRISTHLGNTAREEVEEMHVQVKSAAQHEPGKKTRDEGSEATKKDDETNPGRGTKRRRRTMKDGASTSSEESEADEECVSGREGASQGDPRNDGAPRSDASPRKLPEDVALSSLVTACLRCQPRVLLRRLGEAASAPAPMTSPALCSHGNGKQTRRFLGRSVKGTKVARAGLRISRALRHGAEWPQAADKENCAMPPVLGCSPSIQANSAKISPALTESGDDIIVDSEDEATKNFKGRLFVKRYYKTKHDTYVPTLREFWRPGLARRDLLSPGNGHR
ncbi:TERF1-interacting nuclear factor 2 isoform X2 [Hypomesus transpacificus]|uniref:TERF1-interacting nuclear factor 2 isoform X2 n=1 Tax=Hypomesus transpacificus TaxID=137520 RepID=UPI001F07F751|nr:TERF1-interacting nuclear factor 2 isoform X2 [Hypomesus transpacificus]